MYPNFDSFYAPGFFTLFIFQAAGGTPVILLPSRGSGFRTQLPPKIGSLVENFLLAPSQRWQRVQVIFSTVCGLLKRKLQEERSESHYDEFGSIS